MTTVTDLILDYTGQDLPSFINTIEKYNSILTDLYDTYFSRIRDEYARMIELMPEEPEDMISETYMDGGDILRAILGHYQFSNLSLKNIEQLVRDYIQDRTTFSRDRFIRKSRLRILMAVDELSNKLRTIADEYSISTDTQFPLVQDILDGNYDAVIYDALRNEDRIENVDQFIENISDANLDSFIDSIDEWMRHIEDHMRVHGYPMLANIGSYEN